MLSPNVVLLYFEPEASIPPVIKAFSRAIELAEYKPRVPKPSDISTDQTAGAATTRGRNPNQGYRGTQSRWPARNAQERQSMGSDGEDCG